MAGKNDMERVGLFSEPGYHTLNDRYPKLHESFVPFNKSAGKGKQMLMDGKKSINATQAGFFEPTFKRVFEKEAYRDFIKAKRRFFMEEMKKNVGKQFIPTDAFKERNGHGMHYGTFRGPVQYFSPVCRPMPLTPSLGKNFTNNPGKKGTGYGYEGLTIGRSFPHKDEKYDRGKQLYSLELQRNRGKMKAGPFKLNMHPVKYFTENPHRSDRPLGKPKNVDKRKAKGPQPTPFKPSHPGKAIGGMKAGTFDPYPTHPVDGYKPRGKGYRAPRRNGKVFAPQPWAKSRPVNSIVNYNVTRSTNKTNYNSITKVMAY